MRHGSSLVSWVAEIDKIHGKITTINLLLLLVAILVAGETDESLICLLAPGE
jgi:uncharacterized membrane protein